MYYMKNQITILKALSIIGCDIQCISFENNFVYLYYTMRLQHVLFTVLIGQLYCIHTDSSDHELGLEDSTMLYSH